ncbi:hypothetical protein LTR17_023368 [Elasticomyces elasticus]|nr:hypothetical protein LTR17_023368 [Elasticomyces elasticus]
MSKRSRNADSTGREPRKRRAAHVTHQSNFVFKNAPTVGGLLLTLPPELRNAIYEYVLPQGINIEVERGMNAPPLLQVCREVRNETVPMWYLGNTFHHTVKQCNGDLFERWVMYCNKHLDRKISRSINDLVSLKGKPNWSTLLKWCKVVCEEHDARSIERKSGQSRLSTVVTAALDIAYTCEASSVPWLACKKMLDHMRYALGRYDVRWTE